jgi:predicted nucleotidyltransferase
MLAEIHAKLPQIEALCRKHHVLSLGVFGSATREDFDPATSDLDFVVVHQDDHPDYEPFVDFFDLMADLRNLFHRQVDLFDRVAATNERLIRVVDQNTTVLFHATQSRPADPAAAHA